MALNHARLPIPPPGRGTAEWGSGAIQWDDIGRPGHVKNTPQTPNGDGDVESAGSGPAADQGLNRRGLTDVDRLTAVSDPERVVTRDSVHTPG